MKRKTARTTVSAESALRLLNVMQDRLGWTVPQWVPAGELRLGLEHVSAIDVVAECRHDYSQTGTVFRARRSMDAALYRFAETGALRVLGPMASDRIVCEIPGVSTPLRIWTCSLDTFPVTLIERTGPPAFVRLFRTWRSRGGLMPDGLLMGRGYIWSHTDPARPPLAPSDARLFADGRWRRPLRFDSEGAMVSYLAGYPIPPEQRVDAVTPAANRRRKTMRGTRGRART